jgi:hypothetical protein
MTRIDTFNSAQKHAIRRSVGLTTPTTEIGGVIKTATTFMPSAENSGGSFMRADIHRLPRHPDARWRKRRGLHPAGWYLPSGYPDRTSNPFE